MTGETVEAVRILQEHGKVCVFYLEDDGKTPEAFKHGKKVDLF